MILPAFSFPARARWPAVPGLSAALLLCGLAACDRTSDPRSVTVPNPLSDPASGPPAGNADGHCAVPSEAGPADVSVPDRMVGDGTPASCTEAAFRAAVAGGGRIAFACGPSPVTIVLPKPAVVYNDSGPEIAIDGGGLVTLSGGGTSRILYMNTCDQAMHWTTSHCQDQDHPRLTVQNLTFSDGNAGDDEGESGGGGAIWTRGGRFKAVNCRFFGNVCARIGADVAGGAIRAFSQSQGKPVYLVNCTFGGAAGYGNSGSNGGGIGSIGVSWSIWNSVFSYNRAVGDGGNPAESGTPGGGSGGAVYNDGNTMALSLCGTLIEQNDVQAYGAAIFFVSNDHTGSISIRESIIRKNTGGSWYARPGISMHEDTPISIDASVLE
jgi:hypothetical protein